MRPVPGYEKHYAVTKDGRVYSLNYRRTGEAKELAQSTHPEGYKRVKAYCINPSSPTPVHRLVAMTYLPNPLGMPQVNHIDGDKGNNNLSNLEWVTNSGNQKHAFALGLQPSKRGERHAMHKLTESEVLEIRALLKAPAYKGQLKDIGRLYGVTNYCIFDIKHRRSWSHVYD